jgi:hypothetical protein
VKCNQCANQRPNYGPGYPIPAGFTACAKARVYESFSPVFERECALFVAKVAG